METPKRYHPFMVTLHWLVAILVFLNLYLGMITFEDREGPGNFQSMNTWVIVHMATGLILLALIILRFILSRRINKPADANADNKFLSILAKWVHYGLYLTVLAVTIFGLVYSLQSGRFQTAFLGAQPQFGPPPGNFSQSGQTPNLQVPPSDSDSDSDQIAPSPGNNQPNFPSGNFNGPGEFGGRRGPRGGFVFRFVHQLTAYLLLLLVGLHIAAALYHQFIVKDNLLARMWYGQRL